MNKKEIQTILLTTKAGVGVKLNIKDRNEEARVRDHMRRSEKYGYKFCMKHLYERIFYLEKLVEGNTTLYRNAIM